MRGAEFFLFPSQPFPWRRESYHRRRFTRDSRESRPSVQVCIRSTEYKCSRSNQTRCNNNIDTRASGAYRDLWTNGTWHRPPGAAALVRDITRRCTCRPVHRIYIARAHVEQVRNVRNVIVGLLTRSARFHAPLPQI